MEKLFGRTYESLGTTDSDLILKTRGLVKIQIGRSLIDLVKDNKINVDLNIIKEVSSKEDISDNGIFIVNTSDVYLKYDNKLLALLDSTNSTNVSYLPQLNITYESRLQALKNLGLYYETIEEATLEISNGFVYADNNLYNIINSQAYKLISGNIFDSITTNTLNATQGTFGDISISQSSIQLQSLTSIKSSFQTLMRFDDNKVLIDSPITVNEIQSNNGSFRLTTSGNISRLKVTYIEAQEQYLGVDLVNIIFRESEVEKRAGDKYDADGNIIYDPNNPESGIIETTGFPRLEDGWKQGEDLDEQALTSAAWVRKYGYILNAATEDSLGGVKIGNGLSINSDGVLSINSSYDTNINSLQTNLTSLTDKVTSNTTKITELETQVANLQKVVKELQEKLNSSSE